MNLSSLYRNFTLKPNIAKKDHPYNASEKQSQTKCQANNANEKFYLWAQPKKKLQGDQTLPTPLSNSSTSSMRNINFTYIFIYTYIGHNSKRIWLNSEITRSPDNPNHLNIYFLSCTKGHLTTINTQLAPLRGDNYG